MASNETLNNDIIICPNAVVISLNYFKQTVLDAHFYRSVASIFQINSRSNHVNSTRQSSCKSSYFVHEEIRHIYNVSRCSMRGLRRHRSGAITPITALEIFRYAKRGSGG